MSVCTESIKYSLLKNTKSFKSFKYNDTTFNSMNKNKKLKVIGQPLLGEVSSIF